MVQPVVGLNHFLHLHLHQVGEVNQVSTHLHLHRQKNELLLVTLGPGETESCRSRELSEAESHHRSK